LREQGMDVSYSVLMFSRAKAKAAMAMITAAD